MTMRHIVIARGSVEKKEFFSATEDERRMSFKTDDQSILANYESSALVKSQYKLLHDREANTGKAREIATAFTQARGYLESASVSSRLVRPLLVYYAVLAYSRALTMFLTPSLREAGLDQAHGLSVRGWGEEIADETGDVGNLQIKLRTTGTFGQLLAATMQQSYLRQNYSIPNRTVKHDPLPADASISLGEIFARLPEIRPTFFRWKQDRQMVSISPQQQEMNGGRVVRVEKPFAAEDVRAVFGQDIEIIDDDNGLRFIAVRGNQPVNLSDVPDNWAIGQLVAMTKSANGVELSKIATAFVVSYALGMLVRYYPTFWVGILQNHRNDSAMPTLLAALQYVERDYPRIVVDFLERKPASLSANEAETG